MHLHRWSVCVCHALYNVARDAIILTFGVWRSSRSLLIFGLINPALKIAAFAIEATERGTAQDFSDMLGLILMYPIADVAVLSEEVVDAIKDDSLGQYLRFLLGMIYLILLRNRLQNSWSTDADERNTTSEDLTLSMIVKPKVVYPEWFLHSILYGHKGRLKSIISACVDLDINQV